MPALEGIRVVEMAGLAPVPYCGMMLADFGAQVVRIDRMQAAILSSGPDDPMARGKRSIRIDLKKPDGVRALIALIEHSDVLIDSFRPGVMERLGLGPELVLARNPKLIYARLTGYGQSGALAPKAGHDINYLALSGALSLCGRQGQLPAPPANLVADFAAGGLLCAFGVLLALIERAQSGQGQVIDSSMVDGAASLTTALHYLRHAGLWKLERGSNLFDSGAPWYDSYETKDGKFVAVGALEPQFFAALLVGLGLGPDEVGPQMDADGWPRMRALLAARFQTRTRDEWMSIFEATDACVTPVLDLSEVQSHRHHVDRSLFFQPDHGALQVAAVPKLSRTPGKAALLSPREGEHTWQVLREIGFSDSQIQNLIDGGAVAAAPG
jgi:alpha-methylacyl-CoA racemase